MTRSLPAALAVGAIALAVAGTSMAAQPRASLPDIEDEVMCVQCGTPLNLSNAAVADREREFIRREIARGKTKDQIKDGLVDRFGPGVLALPEEKGFGRAAYLVPLVVGVLALFGVATLALRWRRPGRSPEPADELEPADARRLERELAAYEGEPARERPTRAPTERFPTP